MSMCPVFGASVCKRFSYYSALIVKTPGSPTEPEGGEEREESGRKEGGTKLSVLMMKYHRWLPQDHFWCQLSFLGRFQLYCSH